MLQLVKGLQWCTRLSGTTAMIKKNWRLYFNQHLQIFQERMALIKKWYAAWNESQRWTLLEYVLRQQDDNNLEVIHGLLHPVLPPPDHDFTCVLPRFLCLRIFSLLDPQSLCRAAQVRICVPFLTHFSRTCIHTDV